jgi:hypothetical protein
LDSSFNQVNQIIIPQTYRYKIETTDDKEFLIVNSAVENLYGLENGVPSSPLNIPTVFLNSVLGGTNQNYYLSATNKTTQSQEVYKISEQAVVSQQLNGLWISEEWQNQGLVLNTGIRADDSEYLFASFYIYKDGKPFWVAGTAELNIGSPSISFELYEFTGPSIIENETNNETQQFSFGLLTLTPQSCDSLHLSLETNDSEVVELDLNRITNKAFDSLCVD